MEDNNNLKFPSKKVGLTVRNRPKNETRVVKPPNTLESMMSGVYAILQQQIENLRISSVNRSLSPEEIGTLKDLTQTLVQLNKEEREQLKNEAAAGKLSDLSDEELISLLKEAKKAK